MKTAFKCNIGKCNSLVRSVYLHVLCDTHNIIYYICKKTFIKKVLLLPNGDRRCSKCLIFLFHRLYPRDCREMRVSVKRIARLTFLSGVSIFAWVIDTRLDIAIAYWIIALIIIDSDKSSCVRVIFIQIKEEIFNGNGKFMVIQLDRDLRGLKLQKTARKINIWNLVQQLIVGLGYFQENKQLIDRF